jgi:hypothetical protein
MSAPAAPRPYGPRLPPFAGFGASLGWGLHLLLRRRLRLLAVVGAAALVGFVVAWQGLRPGHEAYDLWEALDRGLLPYAVPLVAFALVAHGFQREVAERTLVYHLARPISRATLYLSRWLAGVLVAAPVAALPLLVATLASGVRLPGETLLALLATATLGAMALGAVYYTLTSVLRFGIFSSLVYTFVVEPLLADAPGGSRKLSVTYHLRSLHHRLTDPAFEAASPEVADALRPAIPQFPRDLSAIAEWLPEAARSEWIALGTAVPVLFAATAALLGFGVWRIRRRDFPLRD